MQVADSRVYGRFLLPTLIFPLASLTVSVVRYLLYSIPILKPYLLILISITYVKLGTTFC